MSVLAAGSDTVAAVHLLGNIDLSLPQYVSWVFSAASLAFSAVTNGLASLDCLLSGSTNHAVQRVIIQLMVPIIVLLLLMASQTLWQVYLVQVAWTVYKLLPLP